MNTLDIEVVLYRDDGLAIVDLTKYTRRQAENFKKSLQNIPGRGIENSSEGQPQQG